MKLKDFGLVSVQFGPNQLAQPLYQTYGETMVIVPRAAAKGV